MHEFTLAKNIVEIVEETAQKNHATRVLEVVLEVGTLAGVELPALEMALESLEQGTILVGAVIKKNIIDAVALCNQCGCKYKPDDYYSICPECGKFGATIISGKELRVKSITAE